MKIYTVFLPLINDLTTIPVKAQEEKRKNEKKLDTKHFTKTERRGLGFRKSSKILDIRSENLEMNEMVTYFFLK